VSVHPDGTGTGWTNVETVDIDQPHGKDYLFGQHIAKGVRKRMNQEHAAFADATVGGIHKPGGAAILGIEDGTATIVADGTLKGHGLVWDNTAAIWCSTAAAGASTTGNFTLVLLNPNTQWGGGDVTWAGEHQFDASGYFTQPIECSKVDLTGNLYVDSSTDVSDVYSAGDVSILGNLSCNSKGDFASDVTINGLLKVDGTATEFGAGAGIGLFYDPTIAAGAESLTLPNGTIIKTGFEVDAGNQTDVSFAAAFPNAIISVTITVDDSVSQGLNQVVHDYSTKGFEIHDSNTMDGYHWLAIGY